MTSRRYAGWTGLAAAGIFAVANALWGIDMPEDGTSIPEVVAFYEDRADRIVIGGGLSIVAVSLFVAFAAGVRQVMLEAGGADYLATTAFGSVVLGMAAGLGAEATNMAAALRAQDDELTDTLAQALFEISQ